MSDRAREYVKSLSVPWNVKSLLFLIADYHSTKEGCAWPGLSTISEVMGIDPRNAKRLIRQAEKTGKFKFVPGIGRGNHGKFYFLELDKGGQSDLFSETKEVIKAVTKEVNSGIAIRNNHEPRTNQNLHTSGALTDWLAIKTQLQTEIPADEWNLWVRPTYLLKVMAGSQMLLALPPDGRIIEAARSRQELLRGLLKSRGYQGFSLTRYPDDYELERIRTGFPEIYAELFDALKNRPKKEPQRAIG